MKCMKVGYAKMAQNNIPYNYYYPYPEKPIQKIMFITIFCRNFCTIDMNYELIPLHGSNIVNPSIPSKPWWCARFG